MATSCATIQPQIICAVWNKKKILSQRLVPLTIIHLAQPSLPRGKLLEFVSSCYISHLFTIHSLHFTKPCLQNIAKKMYFHMQLITKAQCWCWECLRKEEKRMNLLEQQQRLNFRYGTNCKKRSDIKHIIFQSTWRLDQLGITGEN